jgi:hypothetical protein
MVMIMIFMLPLVPPFGKRIVLVWMKQVLPHRFKPF